MAEDLDHEFIDLQAQLRARQKLQGDLAAARASLQRQRARLGSLGAQLAQAGADVQRLEGLSPQGLFYALMGSKAAQLEHRRQEQKAAQFEYDRCREAVAALEREVAHLQHRSDSMAGLEARYTTLEAQREVAIRAGGGEKATRLAELARQLAGAKAAAKELHEAIAAGNAVLRELEEVSHSLESASKWGMFDMLGGGALTTLVKHSRLDDARASAHRVQQTLRRFQRELADVAALGADLTIDVGSFATFADFFFDGLIADWVVQSRISESRENATRVRDQVRALVRRLERQLAQTQQRARDLEAERQRLIAGMP